MSQDARPSRAQRDSLAADDDRDRDLQVLITPKNAANYGYAYHVIDSDEEPVCGAGGPDAEFVEVSIAEAQRKNKAPCQMCDRIVDQRSP